MVTGLSPHDRSEIICEQNDMVSHFSAASSILDNTCTRGGCAGSGVLKMENFRESLIKSRLTAWHAIYLHIFRHLARKLLAGRQPSGVVFIQSDEKSDRSSLLDRKHPCAPDLISASLG
jgi:hypothetical protein